MSNIILKKIKKKDLVNTVSTIAASVSVAISNWAQLCLLARNSDLYFLGVYTLALAYSNPVYQFTGLQLRSLYVSDRKNDFSFNEYFSLRLFSIIFSIALGIVISYSLYRGHKNFSETFYISIGIFILYGIDGIIDIFNARHHYKQELTKVSCSIFLRSMLSLLGFGIGVFFYNSILIGLYVAILFKLLGSYFYDFKLFIKDEYKIKIKKGVYSLIKKSFPLGISLLISSLNINVSKYFVSYSFGIEIQGVFSTMSYIIAIGTIFVATLGQVLLPKMAVLCAKGNFILLYKLHCIFLCFVLLTGASIFIFSIFYGESFLKIVFSEDVACYKTIFPWIMGSSVFIYLSSANGYTLTASSITNEQVYLGLVSLVFNITLNFLFLNKITIELIIIFSTVAFIIQFVFGIILLIQRKKHYGIKH